MSKKINKKSVDSIIKREAYHSPVLDLKKIVKRRRKPAIFLLKIKAVKTSRKNYAYNSLGSVKKLNRIPFVKSFAMKIASCFLVIGLGWIALSAIGRTTAQFADTEISIDNMFNAGTLFFSLYSGQDNFVSGNKSNDMEPCDSITRTIKIRNEGTIPLFYNVHFEKISGDDDFCAYLELDAKLGGKTAYPAGGNSKLAYFNFTSSETLDFIGMDNWQFKISLPEDAPDNLKGKTCDFKFVFVGRDNLPIETSEGFSDAKEISNTIVSADWGDGNKNKDNKSCSGKEPDEEDNDDNGSGDSQDNYFGENGEDSGGIGNGGEKEFFVNHNIDTNGASSYGAKGGREDQGNAGAPPEDNTISNNDPHDSFVQQDLSEIAASGYGAGDGDKIKDDKEE